MNREEKQELVKEIINLMSSKNTTFEESKAVIDMLTNILEHQINENHVKKFS